MGKKLGHKYDWENRYLTFKDNFQQILQIGPTKVSAHQDDLIQVGVAKKNQENRKGHRSRL